MKNHYQSVVVLVGIGLALLGAFWLGAPSLEAQGPKPGGARAPRLSAGTGFTYQGQLKNNGTAVSQACDFQFSLYDSASAGNQIGTTQTATGVSVSNGLFTTSIDFGANVFTGEGRYLQIAVACPSGSGYTAMSTRQALTPTPYASSLVPGAVISGTGTLGMQLNIPNGNAIAAYSKANGFATIYGSDDSLNGGYAVYGTTTKGVGVFGNSAQSFGVRGESSNNAGAGVIGVGTCINVNGICIAASDKVDGVRGVAQANGVGVYGTSNGGFGVSGYSQNNAGVYASSMNGDGLYAAGGPGKSSVSGENFYNNSIGVKGRANAAGSVGVWGESTNNTGVYGLSTNGNGVWGASTNGYAMRADGHAMQNLNSDGWVKAMIYVNPSLPSGQQIVRCFNSQLPGSVATTAPCGIAATGTYIGIWDIDFGFNVTQRFASVVVSATGSCALPDPTSCANLFNHTQDVAAQILGYSGNVVRVRIIYSDTGIETNMPFTLILF